MPKIHKAAPTPDNIEGNWSVCAICGLSIRTVPGGSGPIWVHAESGAVVGSMTRDEISIGPADVAALIAATRESGVGRTAPALDNVAAGLSDLFAKSDPRFDTVEFLAACGVVL